MSAWSALAQPQMKTVRVAVCQILVIDSDREGNFQRMDHALANAAASRAQIAVFPESSILGWENPEAHQLAAPIPGEDSARLSALAAKYHLMIAIGMDEKSGDRLYDSALLIGREGRILSKHRKINVLPELMSPSYSEGKPEDIGVVETEFGRIGVLICADTFVDSHFERLKHQHPDLLLVPYGWAAPKEQWPEHAKSLETLVSKRAAELQCPIVGVDLVGEMTHGPWKGRTYGGASFVADGTGKIVLSLRDRDTDLRVIDLKVGKP